MEKKRKILKVYNDIINVPNEITELYMQYEKLGYRMGKRIMFAFWYFLRDETKMIVYWEEGYIFEEVI